VKGTLCFFNSFTSEMGLGVDAVLRAWRAVLLSMSFNRFGPVSKRGCQNTTFSCLRGFVVIHGSRALWTPGAGSGFPEQVCFSCVRYHWPTGQGASGGINTVQVPGRSCSRRLGLPLLRAAGQALFTSAPSFPFRPCSVRKFYTLGTLGHRGYTHNGVARSPKPRFGAMARLL